MCMSISFLYVDGLEEWGGSGSGNVVQVLWDGVGVGGWKKNSGIYKGQESVVEVFLSGKSLKLK